MDPAADGDAKRRAQTALREALGRLEKAWTDRDADHLFVSSVELATWASSLNDYLRKSDPSYESRRDADRGGRIVRGLVWARNAGVHYLVNVHLVQAGITFPVTFPATFDLSARWRPRSEIDAPVWPNPENEETYDNFVAGRPVLETLREAHDFLWMRAIPNPVPDTSELP